MPLRQKAGGESSGWVEVVRTLSPRHWRRIWIGCALGAVAWMVLHLFTHDLAFRGYSHDEWTRRSSTSHFAVIGAYKWGLLVLCVAIAVIAMAPLARFVRRFLRSWWCGIASVMLLAATCTTIAVLAYGRGPHWAVGIVVALLFLIGIAGMEDWRALPRNVQPQWPNLDLDIPPPRSGHEAESIRKDDGQDDPITAWDEDTIGRAAVVEAIAKHVLVHHTSVVAVNGDHGDGKTSVLNLFRNAVKKRCVVVSFNAWLPGSEASLAIDLFRDIVTECRKLVYVPQLRRQSLAYARTVSESVSFLKGLKELLPAQSQSAEIQELQESFLRMPRRIVVLLDEVDRMQEEELLVLLKILRGVSSLPNVTFVCAFSQAEMMKKLEVGSDYLEKFFPVSVNVPAPDSKMVGRFLKSKLREGFRAERWFETDAAEKAFVHGMDTAWEDGLRRICTNLRKARLLVNDILTSAQPIIGEIDPFDLVGIETLRRFYPDIYRTIRDNISHLTMGETSWSLGQYISEERARREDSEFLRDLHSKVDAEKSSTAADVLTSLLFPKYAAANGRTSSYEHARGVVTLDVADKGKKICSIDYCSIYFRGAVPEEMFSNAELERAVCDLNSAESDRAAERIFSEILDSRIPGHPKRQDFLWKMGRQSAGPSALASRRLAWAAALRADSYAYDVVNLGEAARALNLVYLAAQRVSSGPEAQEILEGAMSRATNDTFARRLWEYIEHPERNKVLTDFSHVDVVGVKQAFMERMRRRYARADAQAVNVSQSDWWALRLWADNSDQDRIAEQQFWRKFINASRRRLAQAIGVIYPKGVFDKDPTPLVDSLFPVKELRDLLENLPPEADLTTAESEELLRIEQLLAGRYPKPFDL